MYFLLKTMVEIDQNNNNNNKRFELETFCLHGTGAGRSHRRHFGRECVLCVWLADIFR